jgi:hypothetical protein
MVTDRVKHVTDRRLCSCFGTSAEGSVVHGFPQTIMRHAHSPSCTGVRRIVTVLQLMPPLITSASGDWIASLRARHAIPVNAYPGLLYSTSYGFRDWREIFLSYKAQRSSGVPSMRPHWGGGLNLLSVRCHQSTQSGLQTYVISYEAALHIYISTTIQHKQTKFIMGYAIFAKSRQGVVLHLLCWATC